MSGRALVVMAKQPLPGRAKTRLSPPLSPEERAELLAIDRRTLFVGMTRAMRALLVVVPLAATSPLLEGFDTAYWNVA